LATTVPRKRVDACHVAARPVIACDEADLDRIARNRENDGNCCARGLRCKRWLRASSRDDHVHLTANEISGQLRQTIKVLLSLGAASPLRHLGPAFAYAIVISIFGNEGPTLPARDNFLVRFEAGGSGKIGIDF
jgi:hypothetical protein